MKCIEVFLLIPVFLGFGNTPRALVEVISTTVIY